MDKETKTILSKVKTGELSIDQGQRQLFVLFGKAKSCHCKLDRLPTDCSIYLNTNSKDCASCGHYQK